MNRDRLSTARGVLKKYGPVDYGSSLETSLFKI